ncbi:MAG: hypothetical protein KJP18_05285 [Gemmatimonadetes bacterium]|nr:hypothetical protein [Gemmatimonadota bacterium]
MVESLVASGGGHIRAILLFGSQLSRAAPSPHSAWDLVVVVDEYGPFHRALVDTGHHRRPAWLLSALGRVLAPNITAFDPGDHAPLAKCAIVSSSGFERAVGPNSPDHFLKGRMVQNVAVLWAKSAPDAAWVRERLQGAREDVINWAGPYIEGSFTPAEFAHEMLRVSYGGEVRPENKDRVNAVFDAQREFLAGAYLEVLEAEAEAEGGRVRRVDGGRYVLDPAPTAGDRVRMSLYFTWSKVRAVARWPKHVLTFNDWLTYIQRKVERRTGMEIEVTPWERRLPLLLLWPKVFKVLRGRKAAGARREEAS